MIKRAASWSYAAPDGAELLSARCARGFYRVLLPGQKAVAHV